MLQGGPDSANLGDLEGAVKSYRAAIALLDGVRWEGRAGNQFQGERLPLWLELQRKTGMLLTNRDNPSAVPALLGALAATEHQPLLADKSFARNRAGLYLALARAHHTDVPRAQTYARQYVDALSALRTQNPADADILYDLSAGHIELGYLLWNLGKGDPEEAAAHYAESMRIREKLVEEHPSDTLYRRSLMLAYEHFGSLQGGAWVASMGKQETARAYYEKAVSIAKSSATDSQDSLGANDYATLLVKYAALDVPPAGLAQSLFNLRAAVAILEQLKAAGNSDLRYNNILASAHDYAGRRLTAMGKYSEAIPEHQHALALAAAILSAHPEDRDGIQQSFDAECGIAYALSLAGDRTAFDRAHALLRNAEEGKIHAAGAFQQKLIAQAYLSLALAHRAFDECVTARDAAQQAIRYASPLLTTRIWDRNAGVMRDAQALLAQCSASAGRR
jgi:tetratricopeptide (TPR) repeat protein